MDKEKKFAATNFNLTIDFDKILTFLT